MNILVVNERIPQPDRSGADLRLYNLVSDMRDLGHEITLVSRARSMSHEDTLVLKAKGIIVYAGDVERLALSDLADGNIWSFEEVLGQGFDIVILPLWFWREITIPEHYLENIRNKSPTTRVVILTDDRHGERRRMAARLRGSFAEEECAAGYEVREREVYTNADMVWAISNAEKEAVMALAPGVPVSVVPFSIAVKGHRRTFKERAGLLFVADFDNEAALDAMRWYLLSILPVLRERSPIIRLTVAGNKSQLVAKRLKFPDRYFNCVGHVPDLHGLLEQHRVFVCPIRVGTGIVTKNIVAMSHGLPVVSTTIGTGGLELSSDAIMLVEDSPRRFVDAIHKIYTNQFVWDALAERSAEHIRRRFGQENSKAALREALGAAMCQNARSLPVEAFWSVRKIWPYLVTGPEAQALGIRRVVVQLELAETLTVQGNHDAALSLFRQVLDFWRGRSVERAVYRRVLLGIAACKSGLGDEAGAKECIKEFRRCPEAMNCADCE
ncbi:MAG TPA: glycosyltransferase family 4 protein [Acidisarcina sp.]